MGFIVLIILIGLPALEIYLFVLIGGEIGAGVTIGLTILTAAVGLTLARTQGIGALRRAENSVAQGEVPVQGVIDGVALLIAGVALATPGFLTDAIGAILLIPLVRHAIGIALLTRVLVMRSRPFDVDDSIDGEFQDVTPDSARHKLTD
jgi:UPF0716 protein FxsA